MGLACSVSNIHKDQTANKTLCSSSTSSSSKGEVSTFRRRNVCYVSHNVKTHFASAMSRKEYQVHQWWVQVLDDPRELFKLSGSQMTPLLRALYHHYDPRYRHEAYIT